MPNDAPGAGASILDIEDDFAFGEAWRKLGDAERSAIGARGFERFNKKVTPYIGNSIGLVARARAALGMLDAGAQEPRAVWPQPLDLEALAESEPQPPKSIMEGLPIGYATGTFGHGGAGKSQIELLRAVCVAAGVAFCGIEVERRVVTVLSCEDRADVLHWRLSRICKHLGVDLASLRGWLHILDLVGHDALLYSSDPRSGGDAFTAAYGMLATHMRESGSDVLVIDGISDTYGSNENARGPVKRFINGLLSLISPERGALLLIGHVNKMTATGGATTEGYSGSTSWHNSCRSRWYLYPETEQDDGGKRSGKLILELQKSNHGEVGAQIEFAWDDDAHLFIGRQIGTSRFDQLHQQREERRAILQAFADCSAAAVIVPAALTGQRTAYHVLSIQPRFPDTLTGGAKPKTRRFWRHIEELRQMRAIEESDYRRKNRHAAAQLIITAEGMRQCV